MLLSYRGRCPIARKARQQRAQGGLRRLIGDTVNALGPKVTLEGGDHFHGRAVILSTGRDAVAVFGERELQVTDVLADGAEPEHVAAHDRCRLDPMADAGIRQRMPRKFFAGVFFSRRGDVRMSEHAMLWHVATEHDAAAQGDHSRDLAQREFRIAPIMAAIDDLDSDRTGIDVFFPRPGCDARVPGAPRLRNALHDAAVFQNDVMRGNLAARRAEPLDRALHVRHAGVMQDDHVGQTALAPFAMVGRGDDVGGDRGIRSECIHISVGPWDREGTLTLRIKSTRCERTEQHGTAQTRQDNGNRVSHTIGRHYSVMKPSGAMQEVAAASYFVELCAARITNSINAFLTLSAVTKW